MNNKIELVKPHSFDADNHFYPKALNSQIHSMVNHFFNLSHDRIIKRYGYLNPQVDTNKLREILSYQPKHFYWGGSDLFYVTTESGNRKMVILETNSCPSGQKSMPMRSDYDEYRSYRFLIENSFLPIIKKKRKSNSGALAVLYDKNYMENSGYAATLSDLSNEEVYLIPHFNNETNHISYEDEYMMLNLENGEKVRLRAVFRYVTQKPWNRIPVNCKTLIFNPTLVCIAGGRNKLLANKAYELYNSEISEYGFNINMPETIKDVSKLEVPLWVKKFAGKAVIKIPYSNAGQGVYTITSEKELSEFMKNDYPYDQFIVQSLIGHYDWSSNHGNKKLFHIGTLPNKKGNIYIADLRVMIYSSTTGLHPCAMYARRAQNPLTSELPANSWETLGTNLSIKKAENQWDSDTGRLLLMDRKDFNALGIGIDDLIEAFIQTVLSVIAIDKMAQTLINKKGQFRMKLFKSLDNDKKLLDEILINGSEYNG